MKRTMLLAAWIVNLSVNPRMGVADTATPSSPAVHAIAMEVLIVDIKGGTEDEHTRHFSGPSDEVAARIRELEMNGIVNVVDRIRLTTLENQPVKVRAGRTAAMASGRTVRGPGGQGLANYQQQNFGTMISATARVDGDAIVVELDVEKSQPERTPGKPQSADEFAPTGTEALTAQVTLRIDNGQTALVSGLENRADAESSGQFILASARLLDGTPHANDSTPADQAQTSEIRIFSLQNSAAESVARVIKDLRDDDSDLMLLSVDARTNSLIVRAENEQELDVIEALLLRLDQSEPQPASQAVNEDEKANSISLVNNYDELAKEDLQDEIRRLQQEVLVAERTVQRAKEQAAEAVKAYDSASDDEKATALLRKLEIEAASRKPIEGYRQIENAFGAAQRAYLELLTRE